MPAVTKDRLRRSRRAPTIGNSLAQNPAGGAMGIATIPIVARRAWRGATGTLAMGAALLFAPAVAEDRAQPFAEGRLWRISKPGVDDSFVLGTIHLADPRVSPIPKPVEDALAQSRTLATELVYEAISDARTTELEAFDDGRQLESLIGTEAYAKLWSVLVGSEVPEHAIGRLKPWAAMLRIARAAPQGESTSLDQRLVAKARELRVRVTSLEAIDEQVASFDSVPLDSQVALLKHALAHRDTLEATIEPTIDAWLRGDLAALARIAESLGRQFPGMSHHYAVLTEHVIHNRTVLMHHRLFLQLRRGGVMVAVGAMHLYGKRGLLAMLTADGYRVTRVW
jgi:uncharacterized protein